MMREYSAEQARALLAHLHRSPKRSDEPDHCRLYFVDVDVLATFVGGQNGNIRSEWSSLFSLTPTDRPERDESVGAASQELANAIALAVSGFILGRFRDSRATQSGRLWLTPEHARELDSMIFSVLNNSHAPMGDWHENLWKQYESLTALPSESSSGEIEHRLRDIFQLLVENSPAGKIARASDVRRRFTTTPGDSPVFPPKYQRAAFVLKTISPGLERRTKELAKTGLEFLLAYVKSKFRDHSTWWEHEKIKRRVFEVHAPSLKFNEYLNHIRSDAELSTEIEASHSQGASRLTLFTRIAVHEISDLYSLSRLIALREFLHANHSLENDAVWNVCLLSGSEAIDVLLQQFKKKGLGEGVDLLHPLSVMRFDQFLRPEGDENELNLSGAEYALDLIREPDKALNKLDVLLFFQSLTKLLSNASASYAHQRDRSLRSISLRLRSNPIGLERYWRVVGNVMTSDFIRTYMQVNQIESPARNRLPMISLPWLTLPLANTFSSAGELFVARIHGLNARGSQPSSSISPGELNEMLRSDPTGYTTCICAALGYLAMGKTWLRSAENVANTAVRTAMIAGNWNADPAEYVPEGNEALYLSAFISRMRVVPDVEHRESAIEWSASHHTTMMLAKVRLAKWKKEQPEAAMRQWHGESWSLAELVALRYRAEDLAREVFCLLIDSLAPSKSHPQLFSSTTVDELLSGFELLATELSKTKKFEGEIKFIWAQCMVALIQNWIFVRIADEGMTQNADSVISTKFDKLIGMMLSLSSESESALLQGLIRIYFRHGNPSSSIVKQSSRSTRPVRYTEFSPVDSIKPLL